MGQRKNVKRPVVGGGGYIIINWRVRLEVNVFAGEGVDPQIHSFSCTEVDLSVLNSLLFLLLPVA